jgi:hypothetical protein
MAHGFISLVLFECIVSIGQFTVHFHTD